MQDSVIFPFPMRFKYPKERECYMPLILASVTGHFWVQVLEKKAFLISVPEDADINLLISLQISWKDYCVIMFSSM